MSLVNFSFSCFVCFSYLFLGQLDSKLALNGLQLQEVGDFEAQIIF